MAGRSLKLIEDAAPSTPLLQYRPHKARPIHANSLDFTSHLVLPEPESPKKQTYPRNSKRRRILSFLNLKIS